MCQCQNKEEKSLHRIYRQKLKESNIASCQCISYQYLPPQVPALQTTSDTSWLAPRVSLQHRQPCLYCLGYQEKCREPPTWTGTQLCFQAAPKGKKTDGAGTEAWFAKTSPGSNEQRTQHLPLVDSKGKGKPKSN